MRALFLTGDRTATVRLPRDDRPDGAAGTVLIEWSAA